MGLHTLGSNNTKVLLRQEAHEEICYIHRLYDRYQSDLVTVNSVLICLHITLNDILPFDNTYSSDHDQTQTQTQNVFIKLILHISYICKVFKR